MRTTARVELAHGSVGDGREWHRITGITPRSLSDALASEPASVQERWFAKLYVLKPAVIGVLAFYWIACGLLQFGTAWDAAMRFITEGGLNTVPLLVIARAVVGIGIGIAIVVRRTAKAALLAAFGVTALYLLLGTVLAPQVWLEPLGPLLNGLPAAMLSLVALAVLDER